MADALLRTVDLARHFGGLKAVDGVSLGVAAGELHAVIGPNGAGKSTLIDLLSGDLAPSAGQVLVDGRDVAGLPAWRMTRLGIGRSYQRTNIFKDLSVIENVALAVQARQMPVRDLLHRASKRHDLVDLAWAALTRQAWPRGREWWHPGWRCLVALRDIRSP